MRPLSRRYRLALVASAVGIVLPLLMATGTAEAALRHGVSPFKVCVPEDSTNGTTDVGQPYVCSYAIQDTDQFGDGITVSAIKDVIQAEGASALSGNILGSLQLIFDPGVANPAAMPTCTGGSGLGTSASPYVGATLCTIPYDAGIETQNFTYYKVAPLDYNLPDHELKDTVTFTWQSLCGSPGGSGMSCPIGDQFASTGSSTFVQQLKSDTSTKVLNGSDQTASTVGVGTPVHDSVTVVPDATDPTPTPTITGNVTINWFTNGGCTGTPNSTSSPLSLPTNGMVDATGFNFTPTAAGQYSFQATYNGDPTDPAYSSSTGDCEPLTVVDANISVAPLTANNPVGATHTFTITVNQNLGNGGGFVPAPDGTKPTLALVNTGGATATKTGGTCATTGTSGGTCTITISSPTTGVTTATASVTLTVSAITLTRSTTGPDTSGDSAPATKNWVPANSSVVTNIQQGGVTVTSTSTGSSVTDQAIVSGVSGGAAPSGTVTFTFFGNASCTGGGSPAGTATIVGGTANSNSEGPLTGTGASFVATYNGDSNYNPSTGSCEPLAIQAPQLLVTKVADATPVSTGTAIGYTITVGDSNAAGTGTATGVTLNDPLPAGAGINWSISPAYTGQGTCAITGAVGSQVLACTIGTLTPGSSISIHISSPTTFASAGTYLNTVTASATNAPSTSQSATIVVQPPGLSITKTADATPVSAGTAIGYTVTVLNSAAAGTGTATGVAINDPLPAGAGINWSISPAYTGLGTCAITGAVGSQVLACTIGTMAPGASVSVHISSPTTGASQGTYVNTATVTSTNGGPPQTATATIGVITPDPSITKAADASPVSAGTSIGFTITVKNPGGPLVGSATGVAINDPLPAGAGINWSISPAYTGQGTCTITGAVGSQVLACTIGTLAPGASVSVHISSPTTGASGGTYVNIATFTATNTGPLSAKATIVVQPPNLSILKTADASQVTPGTTIGFTILVSNSNAAGTGTATGVAINDPLPAGPGINWTISPVYTGLGTCTITGAVGSQVLACTIGTLAPGASVSVHISSPTTGASGGNYVNTATLTSTNGGPPQTSTATIHVSIIHTTLTDKASAKKVASGTTVTFTYTETNNGTIPIGGVAVTGSYCGTATFVKSSDGNTTILEPGATWTYTCTITAANTGTKTLKVTDVATATGTNTVTLAPAPPETAKAKLKITPAASCGLSVMVSPNPLVETGSSEVHAVVQVEACASFAGDTVNIVSQQLGLSCLTLAFGSLQPGAVAGLNSIQVTLDNDGNVTVSVTGTNCTPGSNLIEADLVHAPYLTATTTLVATPPAVTTPGVFGFPPNEVETGDTTASGFSDVYSVFYVETDPVYAETTVQITSPELLSRCLGGVTWTTNQGTFHGATATATLDNDGNVVFSFTGASCASGTSTVIADVVGGTHSTYTTTYTILPPQITPS
jgi:uncharacterized repeat protein (TIGR01451 family)